MCVSCKETGHVYFFFALAVDFTGFALAVDFTGTCFLPQTNRKSAITPTTCCCSSTSNQVRYPGQTKFNTIEKKNGEIKKDHTDLVCVL